MRALIFILDLILASILLLSFFIFFKPQPWGERYYWIYDELTVLDKLGYFSNLNKSILNQTKLRMLKMDCYVYKDGEWRLNETISIGSWENISYVGKRITLKGDLYCVVLGG